MTIRPVLRLGHPALRQRARAIESGSFGSQRLQTLIDDLLETKAARSGAGLAAPQIGEPWRVVVVGMGVNPRYPQAPPVPEQVLINPEITAASATVDTYEEGCLSIPGVYLDVVRPTAIQLSYRDEMGRPKTMKADGLMARCIQHEMDHLKGVLFVDRVTDSGGLNKELKDHGFQAADVRSLV